LDLEYAQENFYKDGRDLSMTLLCNLAMQGEKKTTTSKVVKTTLHNLKGNDRKSFKGWQF